MIGPITGTRVGAVTTHLANLADDAVFAPEKVAQGIERVRTTGSWFQMNMHSNYLDAVRALRVSMIDAARLEAQGLAVPESSKQIGGTVRSLLDAMHRLNADNPKALMLATDIPDMARAQLAAEKLVWSARIEQVAGGLK